MLLFYGKPNGGVLANDENASRAGRLAALRENFYNWKKWPEFAPTNKSFAPVAIHWLQQEMATRRHAGLKAFGENARILVLNAHGNEFAFNSAKTGARELVDLLVELGIREAGTQEIWLAACNNGKQTQDNSGPTPIAVDVWSLLRARHGIHVKVYAPRGFLRYLDRTEERVGTETVIRYGSVVAAVKEEGKRDSNGELVAHLYPFDKGAWVLANT